MVKLSSSIHDSNINQATIRFDDGKVVTLYHNDKGELVIGLNVNDSTIASWDVTHQKDYSGAVVSLKVKVVTTP
ncbi:MAG: hypothetical protein E6R04_07135 [Spirochaetes bacterium]|nr:MAG: hypothetical protein E6R04_07135 [Spirochaetota bacterium]